MACGGCTKRRQEREMKAKQNAENLLGGYKYLPDRQIKARLEAYKRKYCKDCAKRYDCNYEMYVKCKNPGQ